MNNHGIYYITDLWNYSYTIYWMGGMSFIPSQPPSIWLSNQNGIGELSFSSSFNCTLGHSKLISMLQCQSQKG